MIARVRSLRVRIVGAALLVVGLLALGAAPGAWSATEQTGDQTASRQTGPGQPYVPNWFPADLLTWSPGTDPDAAFNRSTTPLAPRLVDQLTTANSDARHRRVMALSVFANTDGNPSQGSAEFDYYTSEFWPYLDTLVFWGGSAGEGLILAPNPTVTDAAHRNGVPVLGTVFLPPEVYGGQLQWVRELLVKDARGHFPAAEKLAQIARYYGFEGWFINQETEGADAALAADMKAFLAELKARGQQVLWYDSMIESGEIAWQNQLNSLNDDFFNVSDLMFLNYGWNTSRLASSAALAQSLGRSPADLHAGVDVGWRQFAVQPYLDTLFPGSGSESGISLALYRPDFTLTGTDDKSQFAARESRFWVGSDNDPSASTADGDGWRGVSAKVAESTAVTRMPFVTNFNTGRGTSWAYNGSTWQQGEWNNLSAQDVLPTWRWIVRGAALSVGYDYASAFRGGSSLRISGNLDQATTIPLYATRVKLTRSSRVELTVRGQAPAQLVLRFADSPAQDVVVPLGSGGGEWTTRTAALDRHAGRTLTSIGVRFTGANPALDVRLGRLALLDSSSAGPAPSAPSRVRAVWSSDGSGARVTWAASRSRVLRYDVEAVSPDGVRTWLGTTTGTAFWASGIPSGAKRIEVVPVGLDQRRGEAGAVGL
ncbi:endo-beta-N-acetylglucosaminidase [Flindersiella endophytica]